MQEACITHNNYTNTDTGWDLIFNTSGVGSNFRGDFEHLPTYLVVWF